MRKGGGAGPHWKNHCVCIELSRGILYANVTLNKYLLCVNNWYWQKVDVNGISTGIPSGVVVDILMNLNLREAYSSGGSKSINLHTISLRE